MKELDKMLQLVVILIHISYPILAKQADDSVHHLGITKSLSNILHSMYGDVKAKTNDQLDLNEYNPTYANEKRFECNMYGQTSITSPDDMNCNPTSPEPPTPVPDMQQHQGKEEKRNAFLQMRDVIY
ncbi:hypothetical protein DINM_006117 [Dirofilaria immitis]|nr:hypothetical protein [Dirofilaria immitis]